MLLEFQKLQNEIECVCKDEDIDKEYGQRKFKGYSWLEFKDTFESLTHYNNSISAIQKFHYLRAQLEANASKIVQSLEFTPDNYTTAWKLNDEVDIHRL